MHEGSLKHLHCPTVQMTTTAVVKTRTFQVSMITIIFLTLAEPDQYFLTNLFTISLITFLITCIFLRYFFSSWFIHLYFWSTEAPLHSSSASFVCPSLLEILRLFYVPTKCLISWLHYKCSLLLSNLSTRSRALQFSTLSLSTCRNAHGFWCIVRYLVCFREPAISPLSSCQQLCLSPLISVDAILKIYSPVEWSFRSRCTPFNLHHFIHAW